jgi:hypothetical protein
MPFGSFIFMLMLSLVFGFWNNGINGASERSIDSNCRVLPDLLYLCQPTKEREEMH